MTRRIECAIVAYALFLVCAAFVQYAHEAWDVPTDSAGPAMPAVTLIAAEVRR